MAQMQSHLSHSNILPELLLDLFPDGYLPLMYYDFFLYEKRLQLKLRESCNLKDSFHSAQHSHNNNSFLTAATVLNIYIDVYFVNKETELG